MTEKENFIKWLEDNNKLEIRFNEISDTLEKYLEDYLKVRELDVSKRLEDVLSKCNEIDYEDKEVVMAYIVMYFLDRLRRFQLNYKKLFEKGLLPIKEKISIIDIGTGPGMSMYALSDMYKLYQEYERETLGKSKIKEIKINYVEFSSEFRNFLHHFTEYLNYKKEWKYNVPYHRSIEENIENLKFNKINYLPNYRGYTFFYRKEKNMLRGADVITVSNFLTTEDTVKKYENILRKLHYYQRNNAIFVVVGAKKNDNKKYEKIYEEIKLLFEKNNYNNRNFRGNSKKIFDEEESYDYTDSIGKRIIDIRRKNIIKLLDENKISNNFKNRLLQNQKEIRWQMILYKRKSRYIYGSK